MNLIVGLGNPGRKYDGTRHNLGFAVLAELARRHKPLKQWHAFEGELVETAIGGRPVLMLAPLTYMNASGRCVRQVLRDYRLPLDTMLVVCDDLNLPVGKLRMRMRGSAGGQLGLADIIDCLGTETFPRLRIGIGEPGREDAARYVLRRFKPDERPLIAEAVVRAADAVETWLSDGIVRAMDRYN